MKNKLLIILTCLSVFLIIPFGLYWIFITPSQIGIIRAVDTGSWLGYYGAIIGGAVTLLGVYWTIINQEKLRKEDIALHEKRMKQEIAEIELRRLEDRRMSIYPYFPIM